MIYEKFGGECKFETEKDSFSFLVDVPISSVKELESEEEDNTLNSVTCQVEFYLDQSKKNHMQYSLNWDQQMHLITKTSLILYLVNKVN